MIKLAAAVYEIIIKELIQYSSLVISSPVYCIKVSKGKGWKIYNRDNNPGVDFEVYWWYCSFFRK